MPDNESSQLGITMTFDEFKNKWLGRRVDYDHVLDFQCVDLIRQYIYECYDIPGGGGVPSAINYWTTTPPVLLTKFAQVSNTEAQKGDIVILWGLPGNANGHIGIATGALTGTSVEILEQNGQTGNGSGTGGDAIRTRFVSRSRIAGLLRPIVTRAPISRQITDCAPTMKYVARPGSRMWNLGLDDWDYMVANPVGIASDDQVFEAQATLIHSAFPQECYYLPDKNNTVGWNVKDCDVYIPPAVPYVPPAPKLEARPVDYYTVLPDVIKFYKNVDDAKDDKGALGVKARGQYIELARDGMAVKLVKNNSDVGADFWINEYDNKLEVATPSLPVDIIQPPSTPVDVVPPPAPVGHSLRADGKPVMFYANNQVPIDVQDLANPTEVLHMEPYNNDQPIPVVQWFEKDGVKYYRAQKVAKAGWWYGIRADLLEEVQEKALDVNHDGKVNLADIGYIIQDYIVTPSKRAYTKAHDLGILDKAVHVTTKVHKQVIDGFQSRRSK
jgi:hypothetical protein